MKKPLIPPRTLPTAVCVATYAMLGRYAKMASVPQAQDGPIVMGNPSIIPMISLTVDNAQKHALQAKLVRMERARISK